MKKLLSWLTGAPVEQIAEYFKERQRLKQEMELERLRGKIAWEKALSERAEKSEGRDADWEAARNEDAAHSWKDEFVLIIMSIPMILSFIPGTVAYVQMGFAALEQTPDWYRWLVVMIFAAVYGIRVWRRKV